MESMRSTATDQGHVSPTSPSSGNASTQPPCLPSPSPSSTFDQLLNAAFAGQGFSQSVDLAQPATPDSQPMDLVALLLQTLNATASASPGPLLSRHGSAAYSGVSEQSHLSVQQARKHRRIAKDRAAHAYVEQLQMQISTLTAQLKASQLEAETLRMAVRKMLGHW